MRIIFATNNENKLKEVSKLLENNIRLITLKDIHYNEEIPETGITLKANALQKAKHIQINLNSTALLMIQAWRLMHSMETQVFIPHGMLVKKK